MKYTKMTLSGITLLGLSILALHGMQAPHLRLTDFFVTANGASVIPVTMRKGELYALLAREAAGGNKGTYDAFGGAKDPGETHPNTTAGRELAEEAIYLLGNENQLKDYINIDKGHTRNIIGNINKRFVVYITEFHRDKLTNLIHQFHSHRNTATSWKFKEKDKTRLGQICQS
jgi:8-oxo-dGTP pyrophosphatase MutT (NUDIX family)